MAMSVVQFAPGQTQTLVLTTSSQSLSLNPDAGMVRLLMVGGTAGGLTFVRTGTGAQTALTTDYPIPAGIEIFLMKGVGANTLAALANASAATGTLYVTTGG